VPARRVASPALALGVLGTLLGSWLTVGCGLGSSSTSTTAAGSRSTTTAPNRHLGTPTPVDKVLPGQCFNSLSDPAQQPYAVLVIGCEQPHSYEIYLRFTVKDGAKPFYPGVAYPGETPVRTGVEQHCLDEFESWIGTPWTQSEFDVATWWPSEISWKANDRVATCAVYRYDSQQSTGSARGTGK